MAKDDETNSPDEGKLPLVLVVDDDPLIRKLIPLLLEGVARTITGTNTNEARALMLRHRPALTVMDDMMPGGISGLQFLEQAQKDPELSQLRVMMLTASDKPAEVVRGLNAGAVDYMTKPFKPETLRAAIVRQLNTKPLRVLVALCAPKAMDPRVEALCAQLAHMQCAVTQGDPCTLTVAKLAADVPDLLIVDGETAPDLARAITHARATDRSLANLYTLALYDEPPTDRPQDGMVFLARDSGVLDMLRRAGALLKARQKR